MTGNITATRLCRLSKLVVEVAVVKVPEKPCYETKQTTALLNTMETDTSMRFNIMCIMVAFACRNFIPTLKVINFLFINL